MTCQTVGLAWMNFFVIYVALPCLFYRVLAQTPIGRTRQLCPSSPELSVSTADMFATVVRASGWRCATAISRSRRSSGLRALTATSATWDRVWRWRRWDRRLRPAVALIFCIDSIAVVHAGAAADGGRRHEPAQRCGEPIVQIVRQIVFHPFLIAAALGVLSAAFGIRIADRARSA